MVALVRTDVVPSTTVGDVADLLDVDMDKRAGVGGARSGARPGRLTTGG